MIEMMLLIFFFAKFNKTNNVEKLNFLLDILIEKYFHKKEILNISIIAIVIQE